MQLHTIKLFPKTADVTLLRLLSPEGKLIGEREIDLSEIERFTTDVERKYRVVSINSAILTDLGRELYEWLDGPAHRWLSGALKDSSGMTLRIHVEGRLRHLPWELLHAGGAWLCFNAQQPFTPARLVTLHNRPLRLLFMACLEAQQGDVNEHMLNIRLDRRFGVFTEEGLWHGVATQ